MIRSLFSVQQVCTLRYHKSRCEDSTGDGDGDGSIGQLDHPSLSHTNIYVDIRCSHLYKYPSLIVSYVSCIFVLFSCFCLSLSFFLFLLVPSTHHNQFLPKI